MTTLALTCDQTECPFRLDGSCLEGFDDPTECPHTTFDDEAIPQASEDVDASLGDIEFDADPETLADDNGAEDRVWFAGHDALTLSEANDTVASVPSVVVLVAGEVESGKTTLLVELYAQFLSGPLGRWAFGGSKTLGGFHRRHKAARVSSGSRIASTERTQDDDLRHLHLMLGSDHRTIDLLLSDLRGEVFETIIDGSPIAAELPFAPRVDVGLVLLDGKRMVVPAERGITLLRAKQLLGGMTVADGVANARLAIVCTKDDLVAPTERAAVDAAIESLRLWCSDRGLAVSVFRLSARPQSGRTAYGLEGLLDWVLEDDLEASQLDDADFQGRFFWRPSGDTHG